VRVRRSALALSLTGLLATTAVVVAGPASGADLLQPADGVPRATITRTSFGIPHVVARDYESLGFGQGYAAAEDIVCSLADTLVTGRGERSLFFGPEERYNDQVTLKATNLQVDTLFRDLRERKVVEALLDDPLRGPGAEVRSMVRGYVAGINRQLEVIGGAAGVTDPGCRGGAHVRPAEPLDLYYGIYAANLLASTGVFVPQIADASPPTAQDPGLPVAAFAAPPAVLPSPEQLQAALGRENPIGSNGTALGGDATTTGRGMVLGNPHFPWRGRYRFTQSHLTIPGVYDVAGAMLHGSPAINIGWNKDVAWTHTVSTGYRFTPYEYRTAPGAPTSYLTEAGPKALERREVSVPVRQADGSVGQVATDLYRTDEGYVLDAPAVLMGWTPASFFALRDANAEHLKTLDVFHEMAKATDVASLKAAQDRTAGIPWVNTMAADRNGDALYADTAVVPNVPNSLVEQCATPIGRVLFQLAGLPALDGTRAKGACAWRDDPDAARPGIFGPRNQPSTVRRDWVVNANDSHWLPNPEQRLEGFARIIGCERCERSLRTRMVYRYVLDRLDGSDGMGGPNRFTHEQLKAIQHENRVFAAELSRQGDDLQKVCAAAGGGRACEVLAGWDGRTNTTSVGAHVFREFWLRTPAARWKVPFSAADPVGTPRDLDESNDGVVKAMRNALTFLQEKGVAFDAPLGTLQVAADDGAPRIPVGGGLGQTGNANVIDAGNPAANTDALYPISRGSSHMQAVAYTDTGVEAATVLSYGISTDPTRASSSDQTLLFSQERWVDFPFTAAQVAADAVRTYEVVGTAPTSGPAAAAPGAEPATSPSTSTTAAPRGRALPATGGTPAALAVALLVGAAVLVRRRAG
jgi:acyl-homoserine-lactone acylase